jgi:hypothetical protein
MMIKVFGERNTSTNALERIIRLNSKSLVHPGTVSELDRSSFQRMRIMKREGASAESIEAFIDSVFLDRPPIQQWKHAATRFDQVDDFVGTHVIFTVRHPLSWMLSLYKNPYHALMSLPDSLHGFMKCAWKTVERERLGGSPFTPLALYREKLDSYLSLTAAFDRENITYTILKFEDLITNQSGCFDKIRPYLDDPSKTFEALTQSTKTKEKDLEYYIDYYGHERWKDEVPEPVLSEFDFAGEILTRFGYA